MDGRDLTEQIKHDLVIRAAAQQLGSSDKYTVHMNPGHEQNARVGRLYPDIVVTERGSGKVRLIIEVETITSVDPSEVGQWTGFAKLGVPFYLVVPRKMMPIARRLCDSTGLKCHYGYFCEDEDGRLKVALKKS